MPVAAPATPARKRLERFPSRPLLPWLFALQGANQNLSAFSTARLDAARISRDPSEKSPCTSCIPAASGLAFRSPGCEPKPVRFFNPPTGYRPYLPQPQREITVHVLHTNRIWLGFSLSRVRTKTCPLFPLHVSLPISSPATPARNRRARLASQPHLAWLFALQGANQNLSAFFLRKAGTSYPAMNPDAHTSDLFPDFSPVPQMVFVNERVSFQTEGNQRVILVHGVVHSHYSREDRTAETYALVSLYESGYADQNDLARLFGYSTRTLRRFQERLHSRGLNALVRPEGRPADGSRPKPTPRDRTILRLKAQGISNRGIAG